MDWCPHKARITASSTTRKITPPFSPLYRTAEYREIRYYHHIRRIRAQPIYGNIPGSVNTECEVYDVKKRKSKEKKKKRREKVGKDETHFLLVSRYKVRTMYRFYIPD